MSAKKTIISFWYNDDLIQSNLVEDADVVLRKKTVEKGLKKIINIILNSDLFAIFSCD